jgi:(heptosyl)LPS beta-1,4-glucosyltransferase
MTANNSQQTNISIVINTWRSAETLRVTLESVKSLGEIVIVDQHSDDDTRKIASEYTEQIYLHPHTKFVEPARNFAISKATKEWILVLDSDEEVPASLAQELLKVAQTPSAHQKYTHYFIPRKNIIFGKWIRHSGWWPDARLRFFRSGTVVWHNTIHGDPPAQGQGHTFPPELAYALIHHHYTSVSQWISRMDRYTSIQAEELIAKGYQYQFSDNLQKPFSEFLRRFFAWEGYKDGIIGLNLSALQALSELVVYLKVYDSQKPHDLEPKKFNDELKDFFKRSNKEIQHWLLQSKLQSKVEHIFNKIKL